MLLYNHRQSVYDLICTKEANDKAPWYKPLLLKVAAHTVHDIPSVETISSLLLVQDALHFFSGSNLHLGYKLYFDPAQYPPPLDLKIVTKSPSVKKLIHYVQTACIDCNHGSHLVSNGTDNTKSFIRIYCNKCFANRLNLTDTNNLLAPTQYRTEDIRNNKRNTRADGKTLPRRKTTSRNQNNSKCNFHFNIYVDSMGFYIAGKSQNSSSNKVSIEVNHKNHAWTSEDTVSRPTATISESIKKKVSSMSEAQTGDGVIRNVIYCEHGMFLSRKTIRFIHGGNREMISKLFSHLPNVSNGTDKPSNFDVMIEQMKADGSISFNYMYDCSVDNHTVVQGQQFNASSRTFNDHLIPFSMDETTDVMKYTSERRHAFKMDHSQHLLLAIGWVHDRERLVSSFFHEVVKVDCTSSICNEDGRSLLTMSSIDSMGNTFVFLRVLIPTESAWVFKWVLLLLTTLFPPSHFNHLKMFITDGDR